ncbi:hypothetical protein [Novosphingobium sp.]|uniref:hypothetical protein n=1 Tax=Novosphingobium sp. TaxID=1874826 RepID=UPI003D0E883F
MKPWTDQDRYIAWCMHWGVEPTSAVDLRRLYFGIRDDGSPEIEAEWQRKLAHRRAGSPTFHQGEIYDYKSIIDGEHVNSRHKHHDHMRKHNVFEIGNEIDALMDRPETPMPDLRAEMARTYDVVEAMEKQGKLS